MNKELVKRIDCRYGTLVIHYDLGLAERIIKFARKCEKIGESVVEYMNNMEKRGKTADLSRYWRMLGVEFDRVFGKGSCKIVFGGNMVSVDMMNEFWNKMSPYFEAWAKEV